MKHQLKLVAAVAVVLMALSGFSVNKSSGGHGGGGKSRSGGGGGCSSKSTSSHSSSGSHKSNSGVWKDSGNRGSRSSTTVGNNRNSSPQGSVVECAADTRNKPQSTVRVKNRSSSYSTYTVEVDFLDRNGTVVDTGTARAGIGGDRSRTVTVKMARPSLLQQVDDCRLKSVG